MQRFDSVLISGASAGIGAAYARALAGSVRQMILVARRASELEALAEEVRTAGSEAHVLAVDLSTTLGMARVVETIRQRGPLDLLINNAGFAVRGPFAERTLDAQLQMVRLHIDATLALTRAALPGMRERGRGYLINVSSGVALEPFPDVAVYGGSKAFLNNFSEALQQEEAGHGIRIQCLCPGYTRTEFHATDAFGGADAARALSAQVPDAMWMEPAQVVEESLRALDGGPVVFIPGAGNRDMLFKAAQRRLAKMEKTL